MGGGIFFPFLLLPQRLQFKLWNQFLGFALEWEEGEKIILIYIYLIGLQGSAVYKRGSLRRLTAAPSKENKQTRPVKHYKQTKKWNKSIKTIWAIATHTKKGSLEWRKKKNQSENTTSKYGACIIKSVVKRNIQRQLCDICKDFRCHQICSHWVELIHRNRFFFWTETLGSDFKRPSCCWHQSFSLQTCVSSCRKTEPGVLGDIYKKNSRDLFSVQKVEYEAGSAWQLCVPNWESRLKNNGR